MKVRKPLDCAHKGMHPAIARFWFAGNELKQDKNIASTINCYVTDVDWNKQWEKFLQGNYSICVCGSAAFESFLW